MQSLHRARQRLVNHRTATVCQIRGLLLERGIAIGVSITRLRRAVPEILEDAENGLSHSLRASVYELYALISHLDDRIRYEAYRVYRRLQTLRNWSHETIKQIHAGASGTGSAVGPGSGGQARFAVGSYRFSIVEGRLCGGDATQVGPARGGELAAVVCTGPDRDDMRCVATANSVVLVKSTGIAENLGANAGHWR